MAVANSRAHAVSAAPTSLDSQKLFKEDRPRRIDRFISFFGETSDDADDRVVELFGNDRWSER
jgi:hypothetical protein